MMDLFLHNHLILIFRNNSTDTVHLSEQGKRALAVEFEKFIDAEIERRNPLTKALESQQVTQLLPALERNFTSFTNFYFQKSKEGRVIRVAVPCRIRTK